MTPRLETAPTSAATVTSFLAAIESDSPRVVEPFVCLFDCFRLPAEAQHEQVLRLLVNTGSEHATLECDGISYTIPGGERDLIAHTYSLLFHWIFGQVTDFFACDQTSRRPAHVSWFEAIALCSLEVDSDPHLWNVELVFDMVLCRTRYGAEDLVDDVCLFTEQLKIGSEHANGDRFT